MGTIGRTTEMFLAKNIAKIVIYDQARVNGGSNYSPNSVCASTPSSE